MGAAQRASEDADRLEERHLDGAEVFGLGEPTHGSANVTSWKLALVVELARRGHQVVLALEESAVIMHAVDDALRRASGEDPFAALGRGGRLWRTAAVRAGLEEIARWNARSSEASRIRVTGIDIQHPGLAAAALHAAGERSAVLERIAQGGGQSARGGVDAEDIPELAEIVSRREEHANPDTADSADVAQRSLQLARLLHRHALAYAAEPDFAGLWRRDGFMAQMLLEQCAHRGGITILSAHNEHVARNDVGFGGPTTGSVLRRALGAAYVPVGVLCGAGECRAVDPSSGSQEYRPVRVPAPQPGTTEALLAPLGEVLLDAREIEHPGPRRFLGWLVDERTLAENPEEYEVLRPTSDFDLIKHLPRTVADRSA